VLSVQLASAVLFLAAPAQPSVVDRRLHRRSVQVFHGPSGAVETQTQNQSKNLTVACNFYLVTPFKMSSIDEAEPLLTLIIAFFTYEQTIF
jgi:hypothetical protein